MVTLLPQCATARVCLNRGRFRLVSQILLKFSWDYSWLNGFGDFYDLDNYHFTYVTILFRCYISKNDENNRLRNIISLGL